MKKLVLICSLILSLITARPASVRLGWDTSCYTNTTGYLVYYGNTNVVPQFTNVVKAYTDDCGLPWPTVTNVSWGSYTNTVLSSGRTNNTATVSNLTIGQTYAFVVVSVTANFESDFSKELIYTIQPPTNSIYVPPALSGLKIISIQ